MPFSNKEKRLSLLFFFWKNKNYNRSIDIIDTGEMKFPFIPWREK